MSQLQAGDTIPEFTFDTPYTVKNSFYELLAQDSRPLFLVFLRNFGHPLTRHFVVRYAETIARMQDARLMCVVRTQPEVISKNLPEGTLPFPVLCDAEEILYDFVQVPKVRKRFRAYSLAGARILKEAQKQGFHEDKKAPQQLPVTLLVGQQGQVLMAHYGESVTDQPESCEAMQAVMDARKKQLEKMERLTRRRRAKKQAAQPEAPAGEEPLEGLAEALTDTLAAMPAVEISEVPPETAVPEVQPEGQPAQEEVPSEVPAEQPAEQTEAASLLEESPAVSPVAEEMQPEAAPDSAGEEPDPDDTYEKIASLLDQVAASIPTGAEKPLTGKAPTGEVDPEESVRRFQSVAETLYGSED